MTAPTSSKLSAPQGPPARYGVAWVPVPALLALILGLWIADLRTPYESRAAMVLLNISFTWLASLCICILTARGFLDSGQPGLLMFGCVIELKQEINAACAQFGQPPRYSLEGMEAPR